MPTPTGAPIFIQLPYPSAPFTMTTKKTTAQLASSNSNIYSNAFNFSSYLSGQVDLRTGQYGSVINLATLLPQKV